MKTAIALIIMLLSASFISNARACEGQEGQFIANIKKIVNTNAGECQVQVGAFQFYNASGVCPLLIEEPLYEGITLTEQQCQQVSERGSFSGIAFRDEAGVIRWEE